MIRCLNLIFEYANYKNDKFKMEITKHRGSVALLYLIKKDYNVNISILSL
jgi:hypothetical protein